MTHSLGTSEESDAANHEVSSHQVALVVNTVSATAQELTTPASDESSISFSKVFENIGIDISETVGSNLIHRSAPSCSQKDDTITFTNVFRIINIDISDDDRGRLISKFGGDNVDGVREFVSLLGADEACQYHRHQVLSAFNMNNKADGKILCFFRTWFEQEYLPACRKEGTTATTRPEFNHDTWISFCESIVKQRNVIPILIQDDDEDVEGVIHCDEGSDNLSSLTPSHHDKSRRSSSQGHRTGGYEGGRGCASLSPQPVILVGEQEDSNDDGDTSVLSTKITNRTFDPENVGSLLKEMRDNLENANVQIECCSDIKSLLWERGGFVRRNRLDDVVETLLCVLKAHADHDTVPNQVHSVLVAFCDVQIAPNVTHRIPVLLNGLRQYESDAKVQDHGLHVLMALAATNEDHLVSIELAGGIGFVLKLMEKHMPSSTIQTSGCLLLSSIAQDESCRKAMTYSAEGLVVDTTIAAMERHPTVTSVQCSACNLLSTVARDDETRAAIFAANGVSSVFAALQRHSTSSLVYEGVEALCRLADSDIEQIETFLPPLVTWIKEESNAKSPTNHGKFSALINLAGDDSEKCRLVSCVVVGWMQLQKADCQHVREAGFCFKMLTELCKIESVSEWILTVGVIPFVLAAMESHKLDPSVQASGCSLLERLLQEDRCRVALIQANAIPKVLATLQQHGTRRVRERGGVVLRKLAKVDTCDFFVDSIVDWLRRNSNEATNEFDFGTLLVSARSDSHKSRLVACVILGCMQQQESDVSTQRQGYAALAKCSNDASVRVIMRDSWNSFIPGVFAFMEAHAPDVLLQEKAFELLANLANEDYKFRKAIVAANGIPAVVAAMQQHTSQVGLQEMACRLLANLGWWKKEYCKVIVKANAIPAVVAAMHQHSSHFGQQEEGCRLLGNLALWGKRDLCKAIVAANCVPAMVAAMQQHLDHTQVTDQGCWALANLARNGTWEDSVYQQTMTSDGVISALVASMKRHGSHEDIQRYGCWALQFTAERCGSKFRCQIRNRDGVLEVLEGAKSSFPNHLFIPDVANVALRALVGGTVE